MAVSTKAVQRREKSGLGERLFAPQMAEVLTEYPIALTLASCCMMTLVFAYRHWLALQQLTEKYTTPQQTFPNHNRHLLAYNDGDPPERGVPSAWALRHTGLDYALQGFHYVFWP